MSDGSDDIPDSAILDAPQVNTSQAITKASSDDIPESSLADSGDSKKNTGQSKKAASVGGDANTGEGGLGLAETALHGVTGYLGKLGGGLNFLGTLAATGGDVDAAKSVQQDTEQALTYQPRTEEGKEFLQGLGEVTAPVGKAIGKAVDAASDRVAENHGPLAGAFERTVLEGAPYVLSLGPTTAAARGVEASIPGIAGRLDQIGRDIPREAAPLTPGPLPNRPLAPQTPLSATDIPRTPQPQSGAVPPLQPTANLTATGAPRAAPFEPADIPGRPGVQIDTPPVEGGIPAEISPQRAAILQRVGLGNARNSALEGNAQNAATDFQLSKFDEPAGVAAKAQFDAERNALQRHAQGIVERTGGTLGTDEDTLNDRGQTMARPFDALQDWFEEQHRQNYETANQRSGGHPVVQPLSLREMLDDPSFQNQLTAQNQMHLRNGISAELDRYQGRNQGNTANQAQPASTGGLTVLQSEQFRKFLNTLWSPQNSGIIGRLKGALDNDVLQGAGEDVYGPARQMAQMEHQTLNNPSGINKIMEHDPQTPINRTTPFNKIPDTIARMPPDQFYNVMRTLDTMPEELQPLAQAAKNEIKAHLANKVLDAGTAADAESAGQWNARAVRKVIRANSAKLQSAFEDQPDVLQSIGDLRSAGNILSVDRGYPGAAAQAANAIKRGFMSTALTKAGATAGGAIGATVGGGFLGPLGAAGGAAAGAAAGETLGNRAGAGVAERAALRQWNRGLSRLSDVVRPRS
jgi:hypothetical protein